MHNKIIMMTAIFREATEEDIEAIFAVRVSVRENHMSHAQLDARGITPHSIAASMQEDLGTWVSECDGKIVGFSMAQAGDGRIFALFVLPEYEGRGIGKKLLNMAVSWLRGLRVPTAWLTTDVGTRAEIFYKRQEWAACGVNKHGEIRFELDLE
ncbi:MAG: GNAT family N-acetyltransferase [Candidatus Latescibacterota bacterium]